MQLHHHDSIIKLILLSANHSQVRLYIRMESSLCCNRNHDSLLSNDENQWWHVYHVFFNNDDMSLRLWAAQWRRIKRGLNAWCLRMFLKCSSSVWFLLKYKNPVANLWSYWRSRFAVVRWLSDLVCPVPFLLVETFDGFCKLQMAWP